MNIAEFLGFAPENSAEIVEIVGEHLRTQQRALLQKKGLPITDNSLSSEELINEFLRSQIGTFFTQGTIARSRKATDANAKVEAAAKLVIKK